MSRKFTIWLDSGANIHSKREQEISLDEIGISDDDWEQMSEDEKDDTMRDIAWDRSDWGYAEISE